MDAAASEFYDRENGVYHFAQSDGSKLSSDEMVEYWKDWVEKYPIFSIEDGLDEDDWEGWSTLTDKIGDRVQLVGDDLYATNVDRLERGILESAGNSILIKVNQIGSLSETIDAVNLASINAFTSVISHRDRKSTRLNSSHVAISYAVFCLKK